MLGVNLYSLLVSLPLAVYESARDGVASGDDSVFEDAQAFPPTPAHRDQPIGGTAQDPTQCQCRGFPCQ